MKRILLALITLTITLQVSADFREDYLKCYLYVTKVELKESKIEKTKIGTFRYFSKIISVDGSKRVDSFTEDHDIMSGLYGIEPQDIKVKNTKHIYHLTSYLLDKHDHFKVQMSLDSNTVEEILENAGIDTSSTNIRKIKLKARNISFNNTATKTIEVSEKMHVDFYLKCLYR